MSGRGADAGPGGDNRALGKAHRILLQFNRTNYCKFSALFDTPEPALNV
jgi:hypothetical protein